MVWYSKNCVRVLPFTCELSNTSCHCCVHDINQRVRQMRATGRISPEDAEKLLKKNIKGTDEDDEGDQSLEKTEEDPVGEVDDDDKQNQAPGEANFVSIFHLFWDGSHLADNF